MKFGDYSPPATPSLEQQRDALQKGLGRAVQWAASRRLSEDVLFEASLRDLRFDAPCEKVRGDWLWPMIEALGAVERFRVPILHALYDLSDEPSAAQLCQLARHYAERNDATFRSLLYEIVRTKPLADRPWLGEEEIVGLDGEKGVLFAARIRREQLASRDWDWDDGNLFYLASERCGEQAAAGLLQASRDQDVRRFFEAWRHDQQRASRWWSWPAGTIACRWPLC